MGGLQLGRSVTTAVLAFGLALAGGSAATAHSGAYDLAIASSGDGGLVVTAKYLGDGHTVTQIIDPVMTATTADGQAVGPVSLISSPEGVGNWITAEPILTDGDWAVTVATTIPNVVTGTVNITVAPLAGPPPATPEASRLETEASPWWTGPLWVALAAVMVALVLAAGGLRMFRRTVIRRINIRRPVTSRDDR